GSDALQGASPDVTAPRAKAPDFAKPTSRLTFWRHLPQHEGRHSFSDGGLGYSVRPLRGHCSLDISGRQKLGKFENFLWSKFFAGLERPVRVMTCENGVIIRSGP